jgi:hypothetical protein
MSYGLQIDGFNFTYGTYSVVQKGTLSQTVVVNKADHPDISLWKVFFVPVGIRDTSRSEIRPSFAESGTNITMTPAFSSGLAYTYYVLGR